MAYLIAQAIERGAEDIINADPPAPDGTIGPSMWPAFVECAKRILAKSGWHEFPVTICPNRKK